MIVNNDVLKDLALRYQKCEVNNVELYLYFKKLRPNWGLRNRNLEDKTGILTCDDFESIAYFGFIKALSTYDPVRNDNPAIWIYKLVKQAVLKEINGLYKKGKFAMNSHSNPDLNINNFENSEFGEIDSVYSSSVRQDEITPDISTFISSGILKAYLLEIQSHFEGHAGDKISMIFQLKLFFSGIKRESIAKIVGYSRRNGIAKPLKKIRSVAKLDIQVNGTKGKLIDYVTKNL